MESYAFQWVLCAVLSFETFDIGNHYNCMLSMDIVRKASNTVSHECPFSLSLITAQITWHISSQAAVEFLHPNHNCNSTLALKPTLFHYSQSLALECYKASDHMQKERLDFEIHIRFYSIHVWKKIEYVGLKCLCNNCRVNYNGRLE